MFVYVGDGQVTVWANQSGNGFAAPVVIRGTPRTSDLTKVRLADLNGAGVAGIVWSGIGRDNRAAFLDLTGGSQALPAHRHRQPRRRHDHHHVRHLHRLRHRRPQRRPPLAHHLAVPGARGRQRRLPAMPSPAPCSARPSATTTATGIPATGSSAASPRWNRPTPCARTGPSAPPRPRSRRSTRWPAPAPVPTGFDPAAAGNLLANFSFDITRRRGPLHLDHHFRAAIGRRPVSRRALDHLEQRGDHHHDRTGAQHPAVRPGRVDDPRHHRGCRMRDRADLPARTHRPGARGVLGLDLCGAGQCADRHRRRRQHRRRRGLLRHRPVDARRGWQPAHPRQRDRHLLGQRRRRRVLRRSCVGPGTARPGRAGGQPASAHRHLVPPRPGRPPAGGLERTRLHRPVLARRPAASTTYGLQPAAGRAATPGTSRSGPRGARPGAAHRELRRRRHAPRRPPL